MQRKGYFGYEVWGTERIKSQRLENLIVVAANEAHTDEIVFWLTNHGYTEGVDFVKAEEFLKNVFPFWSF